MYTIENNKIIRKEVKELSDKSVVRIINKLKQYDNAMQIKTRAKSNLVKDLVKSGALCVVKFNKVNSNDERILTGKVISINTDSLDCIDVEILKGLRTHTNGSTDAYTNLKTGNILYIIKDKVKYIFV